MTFVKLAIPFVVVFTVLGGLSVAGAANPLRQESARTQTESSNTSKARRVARDLGVGRHAVVKLTSGKTLRGHIQAVNDDQFVLLLDREATLVPIAYSEVDTLGPNLSKGARIAIWTGALTAGLIWLAYYISASGTS